MFNMMHSFSGPASGRIRDPIITSITKLGLRSSLQLCLDAGDSASYASGQTWADVSGNGNDFYRGLTSGADATDPTFNGTAGQNTIAEYWSFDGGDYFSIVSGANPTWVNDFFKNNGVGTLMTLAYINTSAALQDFAGCTGASGGFWEFGVNADNTTFLATYNDAASIQIATTTTGTISEDAWHFIAHSFDEGANSHAMKMDATNETSADTSPSPGTTNSSATITIGKGGSGVTKNIEAGGRMNAMVIWNRKMSPTELDTIYQYIRNKYGI